jgi:outer membrane receptor protein involved in Fe transport
VRTLSSLEAFDVPAYTSVDARVATRLTDRLELAFVGKNLNDRQHHEFPGDGAAGNVEIGRSVRAQLTWWP